MGEKVKSRNLSIMLTDLQGYTNTSTKCSREEIIGLIRRYNQLLQPMIEFYGGRVVKTIGDAFLATFESATDAVICGIIIQLVLRDYNQQQTEEYLMMNTRVVVHSGDVSIENNDIYGDAVNVTARIEGLSCFPGGSIGISETTYLLMDRSEVKAEKIGPQELKGIPEPVTVYSVPLAKQKLQEVPPHLTALLKKVLGVSGPGVLSQAQLVEWKNSVHSFLKEKKWGVDFNQLKADLGTNLGQVQNKIVKTFSQESVVEKRGGKTLTDAAVASRFKAFAVDAVILLVLTLVLRVGWWGGSRMLFGSRQISTSEYYKLSGSETKSRWEYRHEDGEAFYIRSRSIGELFLGLNFNYPILLFMMYFTLFWKVRGASPGQIATGTGVVAEEGDSLSWEIACKRGVLMVLSTLLVFGPLMIFIGSRRTFYDSYCRTRVVE
jgi:class 3 adenylate cyclase/uncharacterized RDD family membrane protein YckC